MCLLKTLGSNPHKVNEVKHGKTSKHSPLNTPDQSDEHKEEDNQYYDASNDVYHGGNQNWADMWYTNKFHRNEN